VDPVFNLYDMEWPIRTLQPVSPPAKFVFASPGERFGVAVDSIVSAGCIVSGGMVNRSVLSPDVRVNSYSNLEECILMNGVQVGRHCRLRRVIADKNVVIPPRTTIGYDPVEDRKHFHVTPQGVVVLEKGSLNFIG
jgi:glucose-1-phosphate adenylyltransferase